ncbi:uncharacterized protein LOC119097072 [Pollicipes pollicipes]|uniref:uncharacterized protein LOC119097072 n=1 Tax=Pollicipes pollicipes TaxID=41117 RepID=UPI0018858B66|nr:uncharacterized protein LOC119097072 [Pollicipes pollicipes]
MEAAHPELVQVFLRSKAPKKATARRPRKVKTRNGSDATPSQLITDFFPTRKGPGRRATSKLVSPAERGQSSAACCESTTPLRSDQRPGLVLPGAVPGLVCAETDSDVPSSVGDASGPARTVDSRAVIDSPRSAPREDGFALHVADSSARSLSEAVSPPAGAGSEVSEANSEAEKDEASEANSEAEEDEASEANSEVEDDVSEADSAEEEEDVPDLSAIIDAITRTHISDAALLVVSDDEADAAAPALHGGGKEARRSGGDGGGRGRSPQRAGLIPGAESVCAHGAVSSDSDCERGRGCVPTPSGRDLTAAETAVDSDSETEQEYVPLRHRLTLKA